MWLVGTKSSEVNLCNRMALKAPVAPLAPVTPKAPIKNYIWESNLVKFFQFAVELFFQFDVFQFQVVAFPSFSVFSFKTRPGGYGCNHIR